MQSRRLLARSRGRTGRAQCRDRVRRHEQMLPDSWMLPRCHVFYVIIAAVSHGGKTHTVRNLSFSPCSSAQLSDIKYSHTAVQPSPPSTSKTFSSSQTESLCPLDQHSPLPLHPGPSSHHSTFCTSEASSSRHRPLAERCTVCPSESGPLSLA